jgi:uncharacterized protein YcfL
VTSSIAVCLSSCIPAPILSTNGMKIAQLVLLVFSALLLSSCGSNPGIVQLSPDTYFISRTDKAGLFGNASKMKTEVIQEANEFAAKQGKVAIPVSTQDNPMTMGQYASFDYEFRVVDKNDPEAKRTAMTPRANLVIQNTEKITADVNTNEVKSPDLYTELVKLDELRQKGIITDDEFAVQKKRLLEAQ